jgi:hypothetical protein
MGEKIFSSDMAPPFNQGIVSRRGVKKQGRAFAQPDVILNGRGATKYTLNILILISK